MSRQLRPIIPGVPIHITQRGNNRLKCFFVDADFLVYLDMLREAAQHSHCEIHAYVLMTNHVHLLVSSELVHGPALLMKSLGERFVRYINRRHARTGTLWEGRFHSCLVQCELYLMVCQRYIELNPVRARIVVDPGSYQWSSYRRNAHEESSLLITPHYLYNGLGDDSESRALAYRALFKEVLPDSTLDEVRRVTNSNLAFGTPQFTDQMANLLGRPLTHRTCGRPKNA